MNIVHKILMASAFAFIAMGLSAQNIDPTVVVSRDYEGKLMEVHKPKLEMAVPDSVLRFDLDFDYSVSDSPYKGSYDFTPYVLEMRPSPVARDAGSLYVNAGAGYQLHPELDVVWSPLNKNNSFRMNVFARHRSYYGRYWDVEPSASDKGLVFDRASDGASRLGLDMLNRAGVDGRFDWKKGTLRFDAGYYGLLQQDKSQAAISRSFNAVDASMSVASKDSRDASFGYMVAVDYRYGNDALSGLDRTSLRENLMGLDASLLVPLKKVNRVRVDVEYDMAGYDGCFDAFASVMSAAPRYVRLGEIWDLDLGVKLAKVLRDKNMADMYQNRIQTIYPDVKVGFKAVPSIYLYTAVTGGPQLETYSSLLASDRRINAFYADVCPALLDVTDQSVRAELGIEGSITTHFSYAVRGGYSRYANAPLAAAYLKDDVYCPGIAYSPYSKVFASVECRLDTERIDFDASAGYSYFMTDGEIGAFLPSAVMADASLKYNWRKRIYAGVSCEAATSREGYVRELSSDEISYVKASIPGYVDLGVNVEYVLNHKLSFWAKGWNLLGMTVQRSLFYAEKGPGFTLGVCFNM